MKFNWPDIRSSFWAACPIVFLVFFCDADLFCERFSHTVFYSCDCLVSIVLKTGTFGRLSLLLDLISIFDLVLTMSDYSNTHRDYLLLVAFY